MAKFILKDATVIINGVNLSDHVASVEISTGIADLDVTAMGAQGVQRSTGLRDEGFKVKMRQDFVPASVDATLWPIYIAGTAVPIEVRPTSAVVSTSNPKFTASVLLLEYAPLNGDVGSVGDADVAFAVDGVISRATA